RLVSLGSRTTSAGRSPPIRGCSRPARARQRVRCPAWPRRSSWPRCSWRQAAPGVCTSGSLNTSDQPMTTSMTRDQAAAAVKAAVAERDTIQANLLDLDGSFGKRMLAGAKLVGETQQRWTATEAQLAALWETFTAYSAVVDHAAEITASFGRAPGSKIDEVEALLTGASVRLARTAPLGQRQLTAGTGTDVTLRAAVVEMQRGYAEAS